jgi:hypothetical protein
VIFNEKERLFRLVWRKIPKMKKKMKKKAKLAEKSADI